MIIEPAHAYLMLLAGALVTLVLAYRWQMQLVALLLQYIAVGAIAAAEVPLPLVGLRIAAGAAVCLILFTTLRGHAAPRGIGAWRTPHNPGWERLFHLAVIALAMVIAWGLVTASPIPGISTAIGLAAFGLGGAGVLFLMVSHRTVNIGLGLLLLDSAVYLLGANILESAGIVDLYIGSAVSASLALVIAFLVSLERELTRGPS